MNNKENIKTEEKGRRAENEKCRECADCENISMEDLYDMYDMMFFAEMAERQEKERRKMMNKSRNKKVAVCGIIAAAVGTAVLLIAKKSGRRKNG